MSNSVTKEALLEVLPEVLKKDQHMQELAETTAEALTAYWAKIRAPAIYNRIMELPEETLDILARDFKVDWYREDYPLEVKRRLIHDNWYVHRRLGTTGALRQAISDVWPDSLVEEWYEYEQDPGYFRIILNAGNDSSPVMPLNTGELRQLIYTYKRASAHLDEDTLIVRIHFGIQINTAKFSHKYHTGVCGTKPRTATHGNRDDSSVRMETSSVTATYRTRPCGTPLGALM